MKSFLICMFLALNASFVTAQSSAPAPGERLTAQEIIERIKKQVGVPWQAETVDAFKAGDPNAIITGIAVTMMATLDVLKRAAAAGDNLIITHEPTFYDHLDTSDQLPEKEQDAVLAEKRAFIAQHHLVIWRFHDHWHRRKPDGIEQGMVHALGWEKYQDASNEHLFTIPETTVGELGGYVKEKLGITSLRTVGNRQMKVTRVALSPGASGFQREARALEMPDVQLLLVGETREWETVEYVADAVNEGRQKALIVLSHVPSEQAGMEECARWLKTFINEVPVQFVPAADPFAPESNLPKP